jgi:hypothetical protein
MRRVSRFSSFASPETRTHFRVDRECLSVIKHSGLINQIVTKDNLAFLGYLRRKQCLLDQHTALRSSRTISRNHCKLTSAWPTIHHSSLLAVQSSVGPSSFFLLLYRCHVSASSRWDWVVILLVLYTGIITPYTISFLSDEDQKRTNLNAQAATRQFNRERTSIHVLVTIDVLVDVMFILDLLISFR